MTRVNQINVDELERLIEAKVLEMFGDPDSGLKLRPAFRKKLKDRLKKKSRKISHPEVLKKIG